MIHAIYVIHQLSGVCVLYNKYGTIEFNEDLIAGFLTALKDFSAEVTGGKGAIKVLDMIIYHIHLVFKDGMLIAAASDKKDSKEIAQNKLELLLDEFLNRYKDILVDWNGDIREFAPFEKYIDEALQMGRVAEIPRTLPLLKIYEKDYKKEQKLLKKGTTLDEQALEMEKTRDWKQKRLPRVYITQGHLSEQEYNVAHYCDGFKDINEIAEEAGISSEQTQTIVDKLDRLGMLKLNQI